MSESNRETNVAKEGMRDLKNKVEEEQKKKMRKWVITFVIQHLVTIAMVFGGAIIGLLIIFAIGDVLGLLGGDGNTAYAGGFISAGQDDYVVHIDKSEPEIVITDIEKLKEAFKGYSGNEKLIEYADYFLEYQEQYRVNAVFAAAVSITETSAGRAGNAIDGTNNWFNIKCVCPNKPHGEYEDYESIEESIEAFYEQIANKSYYFTEGNYTVRSIGLAGYCEDPEAIWITDTVSHMTKMFNAAGITISNTSNISPQSSSLLEAADKVTQYVIDNGLTYKATNKVNYTFPIQNNGKKTLSCSSFVQQALWEMGYTQCEGKEKLYARKDKSLAIRDLNNLGIEVDVIDNLDNLAPGDIMHFGNDYHVVIVYSINGTKVTVKGMPEAENQGMSGKTHTLQALKNKNCFALRIKD